MLALVICKIFHSGMPFEILHILGHFVLYPNNLISIYLDRWHLTVLFAMPTAIALLQWTGVWVDGGQGCSMFVKKIIHVWQLWLWNKAPSSASAAEAIMNLIIVEFVWNAPFNHISVLSFGINPMKKWLCALLQAPVFKR
jgi:hypothetical protein